MKAGILLPQSGDSATRENVLYIAKEAESEGLDSVWVIRFYCLVTFITTKDDPEQKEKKFELSRKHVAKIYNELKKGYSVLEIYRSGTGKETQYIPKGIS